VTNGTGLACIKVTSLVRPDLLLKLSSFIQNINELDNEKYAKHFEWKSLSNKNDLEFSNLFDIPELKVFI